MKRWNKIPRTLWTDGGMLDMEPPPLTESTLYLYLRTCDRPTRVAGLLRGTATICDDTGWPPKGVAKGVQDLSRRGLLTLSERPAYTLVHEALADDLPDPGNATKGALAELAELPQVQPVIVARLIIEAGGLEGVPKGVTEGVRKPLRSQEQEQEQEQEQIPLKPPKGGEPLILTSPGPEPEPFKAKKRRSRSKSIDWTADPRVVAIWPEYKEHVGGTNETPPLDFAKTLGALLTAQPNINVDTLKAMPRWIKQSPQKYCADRREDGYFKAGTLYKQERISDRMLDCESWLKGGAPKALPGRPDGGSAAYGEWMHRYSAVLWRTASVALEVGALKLDTLREQLADGAFGRLLSADEDPCPDAARAIEWLCKKADAEREKRRAG